MFGALDGAAGRCGCRHDSDTALSAPVKTRSRLHDTEMIEGIRQCRRGVSLGSLRVTSTTITSSSSSSSSSSSLPEAVDIASGMEPIGVRELPCRRGVAWLW
ncbi:hypothetical protein E2C01_049169 [Portunus trituberculatus]|uniref:Uncharacterized protein n=1 Tax=Portunus trituberculatus TaxID=210409 RepID=A0A5B7GD50_PORTR|nr:hypothetical protein [Portunus trituberculatus]